MVKRHGIWLVLLVLTLVQASPAAAETLGVTAFNGGPRVDVTLDVGSGPQLIQTSAGSFTTTFSGDRTGSVISYCVSLLTYTTNTPTALDLVEVGTGALGRAAWLFNEYAETNEGISGNAGLRARAALQLAIWEVVYDNDGIINGPGSPISFSNISTTVLDLAQDYLDASLLAGGGSLAVGPGLLIDYEQNGNRPQDQITSVPEPSSVAMAGLGLAGGLAIALRRRRWAGRSASPPAP
ncbi:PEP-CTERM sorting domain-containing protein [Tautonia sociabilis]|nr:PEP-CTERM sorting domain-containing protein [Tautonia sociabilis]